MSVWLFIYKNMLEGSNDWILQANLSLSFQLSEKLIQYR